MRETLFVDVAVLRFVLISSFRLRFFSHTARPLLFFRPRMSQNDEGEPYRGLSVPDVDAPPVHRARSILGAGAILRGKNEPLPHSDLVGDTAAFKTEETTESEKSEAVDAVNALLVTPPRPGQAREAAAEEVPMPDTPEAAPEAHAWQPSLLVRLVNVDAPTGGTGGDTYAEHVEDNQTGREYMFVLDCVLHWWKQRLAEVGPHGVIAWSCKWTEICPVIEELIDSEPDENLKQLGSKLSLRWSKTKKKAQEDFKNAKVNRPLLFKKFEKERERLMELAEVKRRGE